MAEILPRHYFFGVIIMMFFVVSGASIFSIYKSYDSSFDSANTTQKFNETFNHLDELSSDINETKSRITGAEADYGLFGVLNALVFAGWGTVTTFFNSLTFMTDVFGGLDSGVMGFSVPSYIPAIILLLIVTIFIFALLSLIFQQES